MAVPKGWFREQWAKIAREQAKYGGDDRSTAACRRYLAQATADNAPDDTIIRYGLNTTTVGEMRYFLARIDESCH